MSASGGLSSTGTSEPGGGSAEVPTTGGPGSASVTNSTIPGASASASMSASDSAGQTTTGTMDSSSTSGQVSAADPDTGSSTSVEEPCAPGAPGTDFSYLWVANTTEGSVSKIDAYSATELARYYTDPVQSGAASPSRTSVSLDGRFVVVSNRDTGSITKIAANEVDCVDRNGDGVIQTSTDKSVLLPYAEEECVLWTTKLTMNNHQWGPRGTTFGLPEWNADTCAYENEKVWVGYMITATQAQMARIDSDTGMVEATVDIPDYPLYESYSPYGAAIDPDGNVWTTSVYSRTAFRIDAKTLEVKRWESPDQDFHYGMTIDAEGRVWFANYNGHGGVSFFDPVTEQWKVIPGTTGNLFRSVAADDQGNIWVSNNGGPLGCGLLQIDANSEIITTFHTFAQCGIPVGVGLDGKGMLWMIDHDGWAWRMDPLTLEKLQLPIAGVHYTYSDFTGSGLSGIVPG